MVTREHVSLQSGKTSEPPRNTFPADVEQGDTPPSCFSSHIVNNCPSGSVLNDTFRIFVLFIGDFTVLNSPSAEVLSSVHKHERYVMCLTKIMCVLDELPSHKRYSGFGQEFNVNESTHILNKVS